MKRFYACSLMSTILGIILMSSALPALATSSLFELKDPVNDDFGWGAVRYPVSMPIKPGELDLVSFKAEQASDGVWFEARLRTPVKTARGMTGDMAGQLDYSSLVEFDFHAFNLELYIDKDGKKNSGTQASLPGRQVVFDDDAGWEQVVLVSSRPKVAQSQLLNYLTELALEQLARQNSSFAGGETALKSSVKQQIQQQYFFPDTLKIHTNTLRFFVPDTFLGQWQPQWRITLLVTPADPEPVANFPGLTNNPTLLLLRPIKTGAGSHSFGGNFNSSRVTPQIVDMLLPSAELQQRILSAFDPRLGQPAILPMLSPLQPALVEQFKTKLNLTQKLMTPHLSLDAANVPATTAPILPSLDLKLPAASTSAEAPTAAEVAPTSNPAKTPALQRLRDLKKMQAEGLIDDKEFQELRAQILKSL